MEGLEWTKAKYIHSVATLRNPFELILIMKDRIVK
jgi:hypothetical protein